ncbi:MAG: acyl-ACP--UDP-N-acetylglucosamine O-acyltransferase [Ignavibacteriales bacterium]|nr:acyl-ACP--UDP-N-acetylglucosamine O-acyltransferase [Ignavibacteriales bacterium]MCF8314861.1 acyl-ACP--UDP-N-acetylglucosamine O-acyltransferase [Ignavibacteriales bacterium]MCF8436190.1 acyl-ACP--UDP-N-acetylglucosamine O-acyltransferase [Ignavibacteriales bacterium]
MDSNIHKLANVSSGAKIGNNTTVHPFAYIEEDVEIGESCSIGPGACIYNGARIGSGVKIFQGASISNLPQDLKYANEPTLFYVGDNTTIREFVTLHRGTVETGFSKLGKNCLIMAYAHIAHDCVLGDNIILANSVQLGGHVHLEDWVIVGGTTPIHQFVKVGRHAMIGGGFRATSDIPPFVLAAGEPLKYSGINLVGLRRRGFTNNELNQLKQIYTIIYNSGNNWAQAKEILNLEFSGNALSEEIINFIESSKRRGFRG